MKNIQWREFHLVKGKKTQLWKIANLGDSYQTEHGQLDGAMQTFSDTPGDKGKPGTKAYVDPTANCQFNIEREVRKKLEHGYVEIGSDGKPLTTQITKISSWNECLPKNFCGYKPKTDIDPEALKKLHKAAKARYTRKYDGQSHLFVHHTAGWEAYSRRMDLVTEKLPKHIKELESLTQFGVGTVLVGELVCLGMDGKDDFKAISRFCRSLLDEARALVTNKEVPEPEFLIFDCLFLNGTDQKNISYDERSKLWKNLPPRGKALVVGVEYFNVTPDSWEKKAKEQGWEGFVVTDGSAVPGDKFYSFDGDAKRPMGHHKLKPVYEEDVVIYAVLWGSGKYQGTVGAAFVKQKHPETKEWINCGKVGSGFNDETREEVLQTCKKIGLPILNSDKEADMEQSIIKGKECGLTTQIEYGDRQIGTQKFRFPVFIRLRDDKGPEECFIQRLAAEEE